MSNSPEALNHAWKWFEYHSAQRLQMIRFYILVTGAIAASVGYLYTEEFYRFSALLSFFGMLSSYCFLRLDYRVSDLIKIGEAALKTEQDKLALEARDVSLKICEMADDPEKRRWFPYSYKENFCVLFYSAIILFASTFCFILMENICKSS